MIKLSKRVEYALMALQQMASRPQAALSAKDIAVQFSISHTLLAKVLQDLVRGSFISSVRGVHGGYMLAVPAEMITVADVIETIEGKTSGLVQCMDGISKECDSSGCCTIREPLGILHHRIRSTFTSMTILELVQPSQRITVELP